MTAHYEPDPLDAEWDKMPHTLDEYRREIRELRERCAAYAAALMEPDALTQTVKAEREACAKLCDDAATECEYGGDGWYAAKTLAAALRARG
jgi:hypothetical protein